ncbi:helix-turn-helix domain-containing protein [Nocardia sp. NPDC059239]|uniref:helix-turn-helix domain-containing protein n=1 Tax=unclassified Nocardia TaxID=2637762 RepID=UPI00367A68EE
MARKKTKPVEEVHDVQQRRKRALELRLSGLNQTQIAEEMGLHKSTISDYIQHALADITREKADEYLQIELSRLDAMWAGIWKDATHGDTWKIDRALAIIDQRARLTGSYKAAELKAVADAKGNVSGEAKSMVGQLVDVLHALHSAHEAADSEAAESDEADAA